MTYDETKRPCPFAESGPAWLAGLLPREESAAFEKHLAGCAECASRIAAYRKVADRLKMLAPVGAGKDLAPGVLAQLPHAAWKESTGTSSRRSRRIAWRFAAAAAVLFACVAAIWIVQSLRAPRQNESAISARTVPLALDWLAKAQDSSGAWHPQRFGGSDSQTLGVTSLVLYSFLKHPSAALVRYRPEIRRGVDYLVARQQPDGSVGASPAVAATRDQGLVTLALVRASAELRDPAVRKAADAGVRRILKTQASDGSWGRGPVVRAGSDVDATVWQLHALIEAESIGWKGLRPAIDKGLAWLKRERLAEGRDAYARPGSFPYGETPATEAGRLFLLADTLGGSPAEKTIPCDDPLRAYFVTRGLESLHEANASRWVRTLRDCLAQRQVLTGEEAGSWAASDAAGGRVSSTAIALLTFN